MTMAKVNRHTMAVTGEIMDELEQVMISTDYLETAPFKWVGLILRFGLKNEDTPHYQRINEKYGDLPVAIELDTHELQHASREKLKQLYMIATLKTLIDIGKKYNLPCEKFDEMLTEKLANPAGSTS